ncbi:MAG: 30S ribosomal protein S6 [Candidatus Peribacteraceae bacterium]|nr:30S ribosomal protein S6 [Candidatus Peribacteraceae bacterium]
MPELQATSEEKRVYELCVLIPYPLSQKEEQEVMKNVESIVEDAGGKQVAKDIWGRRGLAYKIGGATEGNFIIYHYELDPSAINEIDESLRIAKHVLRHLIVKPPKEYQIVAYSKKYEEWLKDREKEEETLKKTREEDLRKKMIEKQKRQTVKKPAPVKQAKETEKTPANEERLTEEIDKLIADDELEL